MASLRLSFFIFMLALTISNPVNSNEDEDKLLQGLNSYRTSSKLPLLKESDNAECVADEVADKMENQPCTRTNGVNVLPGSQLQFSNYPDALKKCKIDINTTTESVILPACVPHRVSTLVLSNYTESAYSKYLNDSKYTGVGIGSEDDWMVVVLTTNTPAGSFVNAAVRDGHVGFRIAGLGRYLLSLFMWALLVL